MASSFYFQISTEQVLLALEGALEADELEHWKALLQRRVQMPRKAYEEWAKHCLLPFGATLSTGSGFASSSSFLRLKGLLKLSSHPTQGSSASEDEKPVSLEWLDEEEKASGLKPGQVRRHRLVLMGDLTADGGQQFQVSLFSLMRTVLILVQYLYTV